MKLALIAAAAVGLYLWHRHAQGVTVTGSATLSAGTTTGTPLTAVNTGQVSPSGVAQTPQVSLPIVNTPTPIKGNPRVATPLSTNVRDARTGSPKAADGTLRGGPIRAVPPITASQKAADKAANTAGHQLRTRVARTSSPHAAAIATHRLAGAAVSNAEGITKSDVRAAYQDPTTVAAGSTLAPFLTGGAGSPSGAPLALQRGSALQSLGLSGDTHVKPSLRQMD
jgi:hypothetical protein